MADLSKIKLNGVEYDLKDAIARKAIENIPQMDGNKINKAWSIIEADSGETTIVDMVPQQTINLTGDFETDLVNNVNFPEEETECIVSFDLYEEQTLIISVLKNITTPYDRENNPFYFTFDNGNYKYNLIHMKEGNFGIAINNDGTALSSPYRIVNFHIYREIPIMIPTIGWNSEAVPIPTNNDIGTDLKVGYKILDNQILTHGQNSVYISQPTVTVSTDSIFSNNFIVPDGIYTTTLNSSKYTNFEIELTPYYYNSKDGEEHYYLESRLDKSDSYPYYFTIYENGNVRYGPHRNGIYLNEDISFTDIMGPIKKPVLNWTKDDDNILKVIFTNESNNILSCGTKSKDIYQAFLDKKIIMGIYENEIYYISNITSANNISFISDNDTAKIKKKLYYTSLNGWSYQEIDIPITPDVTNFMVKGTDYVTAGQKSGTTLGSNATAEGSNTTATGNSSHAEGSNTIASNIGSHAEGNNTTASGNSSHAEGSYTTANVNNSHAEGSGTTASGQSSHAEGSGTTASGMESHAEGEHTTASGNSSHAEGQHTTASGNSSHAEGVYTIARRKSQHVFGEYNILDTSGSNVSVKGKYIEIVGNGTSSTRSNARTLDWSGNEVLAGKLTVGTAPTDNMDVTTKQYVDNKITTDIATAIGGINQFEAVIVTDLPTTDIDTHTIYFKSNSSSGNNVYDEYMYINNNWELIGSTQIDLTPYARSADLATVATSGDYDDLTDAPVAETDANVEDMLDSFYLDYTSNTSNPNYAAGVSF